MWARSRTPWGIAVRAEPRGLKITNAGARFIQDVREAFGPFSTRREWRGSRPRRERSPEHRHSTVYWGRLSARTFPGLFDAASWRRTFDWVEGAPPTEQISWSRGDCLMWHSWRYNGGGRLRSCYALDRTPVRCAARMAMFLAKRTGRRLEDLRGERFIIRQAKCDPASLRTRDKACF